MAKNKTTENQLSIEDFINSVTDEVKRKDCFSLIELLRKQTALLHGYSKSLRSA